MSVYEGDFLGFQLGDIHSSQLNITRVSNNDRYTENLSPLFKDQTAEVPGGDGQYFWGTSHSSQTFIIDFAFDDLRDEDIRRLRQVFSFKGVQELIFDETPYKKYYVKCQNPPTLKYIAFDVEGVRVYKGEGTANFIAYYPYGVSANEIILDGSSPLSISNIGDMETPVKVYYNFASNIDLRLNDKDNQEIGRITLSNMSKLNQDDSQICINTKTYLIEGLRSDGTKTGSLYNKFLTTEKFFNLPKDDSTLQSNPNWTKVVYSHLYY